ncbi:MAG: D-2-hydroxyacid dehydrogenase [Clostridia bacterium]|nr:D-2-hydroxyacid dehydrogenase [Clostridia bacterium]
MKISVVDFYTVDYGDLDITPVTQMGDVSIYGMMDRESLIKVMRESDAIIVNKVEITEDLLDACPGVKYVGTCSTGYNNIDVDACRKRGITVCNVPGYSTDAVCQHVFALLLSFESKTHRYIPSVSAGDWQASSTFCYNTWPTSEIAGKTIGIVGYGAIGSRVAKVADAFGMKVIVHDILSRDCPYETSPLEDLLKRSDVVTLHCPLTKDNVRFMNKKTLSLMKNDAVLINTARGALVDEEAVTEALKSGSLRGFCADTLTEEPPKNGSPLIGLENSLITPHIAWCPKEARQRLVKIIAENFTAFRDGHPQNVVT